MSLPEERVMGCVDAETAARMAATLDWAKAPVDGDPLPALWHWLLLTPIARASALDRDGHPHTGEPLPGFRQPMRMWAGSRLRYDGSLRVGDAVERRSFVQQVQHKQGRSGPLAFVTYRHEYRVGGRLLITDDQDLVYRERPTVPAATVAPVPAPHLAAGGHEKTQLPPALALGAAQFSREIVPDSALLFRYSALTFNAHRIHYDRDYAMKEEGYPGLVVQGPLTATLLAGLLERERPLARIATLSFRAERPLFDTAPFSIHGRCDGARAELWTQAPTGGVTLRMDIETTTDA